MKLNHWIQAARPKTLPAAIAPVIAASGLAWHNDTFSWIPAALCMAFALLIQIATNFANDYFDFKKGTDNENRIGPKRAVAQGWISPGTMWIATLVTLALALAVGLQLLWFGGYPLLIVGVLSIVCAILYTGGPFPLAYVGLGDLFVLIFFGWIAVMFTYFVQAGHHSWDAFIVGTAIGLLSVNLLLINNYRDVDNDKASEKKTTVVRFGRGYGRMQYLVSVIVALVCTFLLAFQLDNWWLLLAMIPLLRGLNIAAVLKHTSEAAAFARLLKSTAGVLMAYAILLSVLLIFS